MAEQEKKAQSKAEAEAAKDDKEAKKEAEENLTRAEKEQIEDGKELAEKYQQEQEDRDDDDPLVLQKRDAEPGEAVPVGAPPQAAEED